MKSFISDLAISDTIVIVMTIMFWTIPSWFTITDFRFIPIVVTAGHIAYTTSIYLGNVIWVIDFPICFVLFFLICHTGRLTLNPSEPFTFGHFIVGDPDRCLACPIIWKLFDETLISIAFEHAFTRKSMKFSILWKDILVHLSLLQILLLFEFFPAS